MVAHVKATLRVDWNLDVVDGKWLGLKLNVKASAPNLLNIINFLFPKTKVLTRNNNFEIRIIIFLV